MEERELKNAAEAIIFACGTPVESDRIAQALGIKRQQAVSICDNLVKEYSEAKRGIRVIKLNESYQMCTVETYAEYIREVMDLRRNTPLSQAASEVLAVIAYNQPVTKAFIEQVRGVDCSGVVSSLVARQLIEEKGRLELPGRPLVYGTTEHFLRCFNISSLDELPPLPTEDEENKDENSQENNQSGDEK
ncbi:MAG: SMC-Scp complex subunit ScpB [Clostridia bacterium]|nr:SMC-Scp complex subunit ScpB [Clostridia bacterium]